MRFQVNVTPDISLQWYGAPFTSTAKYNHFKQAVNTESRRRDDRFHRFSPDDISSSGNQCVILNGMESYHFPNPDFNFNEFRTNFVGRWEYLPGSTIYLVWEYSMSNRAGYYLPRWDSNLERMFGLPSRNIVMVKLNYFFNL